MNQANWLLVSAILLLIVIGLWIWLWSLVRKMMANQTRVASILSELDLSIQKIQKDLRKRSSRS